jgi:biopolymer transport protein ExbB
MFEGKSFLQILHMGGWTLYVLLGVSILSVTVMLYKGFEFWRKSRVKRSNFTESIAAQLKRGNYDAAINLCKNVNSPMASVARAGITASMQKRPNIAETMQREIAIETVNLDKFTAILGTIGGVSVYIGLFGTVLGIIRSFHDISSVGSGGITVVIAGVSEALIATASGLCVAIPAVIAYNFFSKTIEKFVVDMEYCASTVEEFINYKQEQ